MKGFAAQFNQLFGELYECVKKSEQETLPGHQKLPLSAGEFHLLEQIGQTPEGVISVSDLAKRLQVAKPSASVAVNKLLRKGFVEKAPSRRDGRSILVSLTHQGKLLPPAAFRPALPVLHRGGTRDAAAVHGDAEALFAGQYAGHPRPARILIPSTPSTPNHGGFYNEHL